MAEQTTVVVRPLSVNSHKEPHFGSADVIRDVIIGLSDGLTVPFALSAGLASLNDSRLVLIAGAAEIIAGSISMGLGGFLAGLSEIEHFDSERKREVWEVENLPLKEEAEVYEVFEPYGVSKEDLVPLMTKFKQDKESWVDFMMKFELNLERPDPSRSWISALTIGISYLMGGVIPLLPYLFIPQAQIALIVSAVVTIVALFIFGFVKSKLMGTGNPLIGAIQMAIIGKSQLN